MSRTSRVFRSEQGAVFVQIGISIFVLMAFNVFVLDYGAMWVSRRQAQNAADAGALAGAVARGYDDFDDPPASGGPAAESARLVAEANLIWQQPGTPDVTFNCPPGVTGKCVQVDVYRNGEFGSQRLPTFFGPILGITDQGVRASATAIAGNGNSTNCLKPWAMPDDWNDVTANFQFDAWVEPSPSPGTPVGTPDVYTAPSSTQTGRTTVSGDFGQRLNWTLGAPILTAPITSGLVLPLVLPGGNTYEQNMLGCNGATLSLNQTLPVHMSLAGGVESTTIVDVFDLDASATYDPGANEIANSCAPGCAAVSPRLLAIVLYDPDKFQRGRATNDWTQAGVGCPSNNPCVTVSNILGYYVHCVTGRPCVGGSFPPHGHFHKYPGMTATGPPTFVDDASWLVTSHLVR